ncbi:MAG: pacearchaeosortase [Candidatus Woesearchaeota archaeon]
MKYESNLILRTILAILVTGLYNFFYLIFTPATIYSSWILLKVLGYDIGVFGNNLVFSNVNFIFIEACVALSAYYLLFLLIVFTKGLSLKTSLKLLVVGTALILVMNIIRIDLLIILFLEAGKTYFDVVHMIFWKFIAGIYVALVWIVMVRKFKIKSIPIYSDLKELYDKSLFRRKK